MSPSRPTCACSVVTEAQVTTPRLILIGPPASGKTKIGRLVARALGEAFVDTDALITERFGPIPRLFAEHGEPWFREREAEIVQECLREPGVVALGGGAVITASTRLALADARVCGLTIAPEAVEHRISGSEKRPLLAGGIAAWKDLVAARQHWYDEVARHTVDVSHRDPSDVAGDIVTWLEGVERGH